MNKQAVALLTIAILLIAGTAWVGTRPRLRYGVHTLDAGPETLALAHAGRFDTVVQLFSWREIEPTQGEYHWEHADEIVQGAGYYGLNLVVRLDQHPAWASKAPLSLNAPPDDPASYARFTQAVAARYRSRVLAYIIWNEPNLSSDWGGRVPDPAGYVSLLKVAYQAIKRADPGALVVSAGLASTNERSAHALDDLIFLQGMYEDGAAAYFDVLGAHPYGFGHPPDDPRGAHDGMNMARLEDLREIMNRNGDGGKQVWATEMGWTTRAADGGISQAVTPAQQAAYLAKAAEMAPRAWPWLGLFAVWNLDGAASPDWGGYSLVDEALRPGPAYLALQALPRPRRLPDLAELELLASRLRASRPGPESVALLAPDSVIHLGDSQYSRPWVPLQGNRNPSTLWQGIFYLPDGAISRQAKPSAGMDSATDCPAVPPPWPGGEGPVQAGPGGEPEPAGRSEATRDGCWHLDVRVMQSNTWGNYVWINGHRLEPPLPESDFTNSWYSVRLFVPPEVLVPGPNRVGLTIGRAAPLLEDGGFTWDDMQIKDMVLAR